MTTNIPITDGQIQNPLLVFTKTIPTGVSIPVDYAFNYFRVLDDSAEGLLYRFGGWGNATTQPSGIGYNLPFAVDNVLITNPTGADITVTFAMAMGEITDDRLQLSTAVDVIVQGGEESFCTVETVTDTATLVLSANTARKSFTIQNAGTDLVEYIGTDSAVPFGEGIILFTGGAGSYTGYHTGDVYMIADGGNSVDVRIVENV